MKTTIEFLNAVKARYNIQSDYALSGLLEITRASVSRLMSGRDFMGVPTAMKVAELLDLDSAYVVACAQSERAGRADHASEKKMWERIAEAMAGVAAVLALACFLPSDALKMSGEQALVFAGITADSATGILYIMRISFDAIILSITAYWWLFLALFAFSIYHLPRKNPPKE